MGRETYLAGVESALHGAGLPYGYAITVWSSGQVLINLHGSPAIWMVFLFAAGAAAAYGLLRWSSRNADPSGTSLGSSPHLLRAGVVHVAAIAVAVGAVTLLGLVPSAVVWPLGGFAATLLYLLGTAVEMGLRERERQM